MASTSFSEAHRYKGGIIKYLFDKVDGLKNYNDTAIKNRVKDLEDAVGDEETEGTILARIKALEDAP